MFMAYDAKYDDNADVFSTSPTTGLPRITRTNHSGRRIRPPLASGRAPKPVYTSCEAIYFDVQDERLVSKFSRDKAQRIPVSVVQLKLFF